MLQLGLERMRESPRMTHAWGNCALLSNQASVTATFTPSWAVACEILGPRLRVLLGPQHGFESTVQDNMIESGHAIHRPTGLPVYSLYSETREPTDEMLDPIDTLIIDIQITGTRVYTFKWTIAYCLKAAKRLGKRVVILDRPNPLGGQVLEGRVLDMKARSFVGEAELPMRHGLTPGEVARLLNLDIGADFEVVALNGWNPERTWEATDRHWVLTSPNLPTIDPVYVYPGTVLFEGTNVSEGRGTGLPFQFIGAPFIKDARQFVRRVRDYYPALSGVHLREAAFQPTSQKWANDVCHGAHIIVTDPQRVRSFTLAVALLRASMDFGGSAFAWKQPPYEYDYHTLPIKLIVGSHETVEHFTSADFNINDPFWHEGLAAYAERARPVLLYERSFLSGAGG